MGQERPQIPEELVAAGWAPTTELGHGGQATVFAVRRGKGERAALKLPKPTSSETDLERFRREIRTLESIQHDNVIHPLAASAGELPWLLLPLGVDLSSYWKRKRPTLEPAKLLEHALPIVGQIVEGLTQIHERGETHRDLKPKNIIMFDEVPKISDAGILYTPAEERLTEGTDRPIRRAFHRYSKSASSPRDAPPQWEDCLHIAWVLGWMLLREPQPFGNYHWKYVPLVENEQCELIARTLMAQCSHEDTAPHNAHQLRELLDQLMRSQPKGELPGDDLKERLIRADQVARANAIQDRADRLERTESAAPTLERVIQPIRDGVAQGFSGLEGSGAAFSGEPGVPTVLHALRTLLDQPKGSPLLFKYVFGGQGTDPLVLKLRCISPEEFHLPHELPKDFLPYVFDFHLEHPRRENCQSVAYVVARDGRLWTATWPRLVIQRETTPGAEVERILKLASDPRLRPLR